MALDTLEATPGPCSGGVGGEDRRLPLRLPLRLRGRRVLLAGKPAPALAVGARRLLGGGLAGGIGELAPVLAGRGVLAVGGLLAVGPPGGAAEESGGGPVEAIVRSVSFVRWLVFCFGWLVSHRREGGGHRLRGRESARRLGETRITHIFGEEAGGGAVWGGDPERE